MSVGWLLVFLLLAAADWMAVRQGWQRVCYITKPAAMTALIVGFGIQGRFAGSLLWFGIGFFFSLLGDIFLLLTHRYFSFGLMAFLIAHLAYIVGFNSPLPEIDIHFVILGLLVLTGWGLLFYRFNAAMRSSTSQAKMRLPVALYSAVLSMMLFSALLTLFRPDWSAPANVYAVVGGLLFFVSDTMLAFDRFVRPFKDARFWVRVTYHLGQLGLAVGVLLHVLR